MTALRARRIMSISGAHNRKPVIALFSLIMVTASPLAAAELRCPGEIPSAHVGFDQMGPVPTAHWQLDHMRLFDGPPGEELKAAPADLAPDTSKERRGGYTNIWSFGGREDLLMVCVYKGSKSYYRAQVKPLPKSCTEENDKGLDRAWCQ